MYKVLVIDDEDAVREAVRRRLERAGHEVECAATAAEGIETISQSDLPFDVIICDMSMEDPHAGLRVLNAAFARDLFAEVIVMTAYGNIANAVECMKRGAFDYLEKNVPGVDTFELIVEKVDAAMDRRRQDVFAIERWERVARVQEKRAENN